MKLLFVLVLTTLSVLVCSSPTVETRYESKYKIGDKDFLEKQRKILSLFRHINQHCHNAEHEEVIKTFELSENKESYTNPEAVKKIIEHYTKGYSLPKGEIFSISYPEHLEQAIALFDLLFFAKDFDTFYKTAIVSRHWVNEGLFLYACSLAIVHRPDCYGLILPPIYELYPHFFFNTDTIQEAYRCKQTWNGQKIQVSSGKYPGYTIISNYSGHYLNLHPEQSLSYYLEDVGINSFYYTYYLYYPFWMSGTKYEGIGKDRRGELYYFIHQQLWSRFYLERLSNDFGKPTAIDFEVPVETSFYPSLQYPNGLNFPERPKFARLSDYFYSYGQKIQSSFAYSYSLYKDYSRRIVDAIDRGYALDKQGQRYELYNDKLGYERVGNLLQSNPDSPDSRYYGPWLGYGRHLLGYSTIPLSPYKVAPSVLEHMETSLRDPIFYQLYKHLMLHYARYQLRLEPYTREELNFPGVSIEKVEMDRLITYFDEFYSDLSQAVFYTQEELSQEENNFFVRAKQYRLNHKPFTYKIHVKSDRDVQAVVKIFIGPKYDEYGRYINISDNRCNFFELDKFIFDLKTGDNLIKRSSYESKFFSSDKTSYYDLYKQVLGALDGQKEFTVNGRESYFNFPLRYMLPKGDHGGQSFQFYFIVYPYKPYTENKPQEWTYFYPRPGVGGPYIDDYPLYYPFDRPIKYGRQFYQEIPNSFFYEAKIYHKIDVNIVSSEEA
ncbi:allergen Cr-PI-like [Euwallacea similis]|uniref:allergen Cr-PI-like n=1 Tax=Euwallacea similis TaxID=1736056 RepID=UPI00344E9C05